uniref:Coiled-coil domain-containing protein 108 n=1 Tax=Haptolina brevifila TaxID=156173 RepID=A0A6U7JJ14_9EUKA
MGDVASIQASLPTIDMMMPPGLPGDPPMQLHLLVRNVGKLDAAFQVRYPTEMELQIEHWADKGEPSAVELKQHLIVDKNILAITPKKAELAPGQDVELIVRMRHFRADDYELPLLLQVTSGRQLVLNVQGRTLALGERYLHIPLREVRLPPTPIGLETAQRHTFELPNYTDVELPFDVQLAEINKLNKANHDFPIFVCENPTGVIPPGGIAHLRFRFLPLEEKDYHVALPVAIGSAGIRTFVLLASGYHPRDPIEYASFLNDMADLLPPSQQLMPPNQPMRLSFDRALFGQVPSGATLRKLVVIRNVHSMPCGYAWDTNHPLWGTILSVYPSHGTVAAGEHVCCKLSLSAIGPPEELKSTLHCHLTPHIDPDALTETEKALASSAHRPGSLGLLPSTHPLAAGTALRPRSPPRISVTEVRPRLRGLQALMHIEEREGRRQAAAAGLTAEEYSSTAAASNIAAVTLPPSAVNASLSGSGAPPSQPPKLLLDVRACISPPEVLELGGVSLSNFYIPRVLPPTEPPLPPSANTATSKPLHWHLSPAVVEQRETAEAIVSMMLTELLSDPTVTRAITSSDVAPVPWFDQVATSAAAAAGSASKGNALPLAGGYSEETAAGMPPAPMGMHMPIGGAPAMGGAPPPSHFAPQGGEPSSSAIAFEVGAVAAGATGAVGATTGGGGMASEALDEYAEEAAMEEADKLARAQRRADEVERKRREAEHAGRIRNSTDFQELVAYVLEGTLFNLVVEASHGEFPLETVPRQIVRSLEITQEESA